MPQPIMVCKSDLPSAWEEAVLKCWEQGMQIKTEYDKPEDPPSRDCTAMIVITNPLAEPRIHRAFPGGLDDLKKYELEVTEGVHDHWIKPEEGKWGYTYHDRLVNYPQQVLCSAIDKESGATNLTEAIKEDDKFDQMDYVLDKLEESPHTRRAQAIIWNPKIDSPNSHCPCAQRFWFRIFDDSLHMNMHIRSNDAFKAGFMNMWAFIQLQAKVAMLMSNRLGREITVGPYCHIADSFHIYGSYFDEFEGFLKSVKKRPWEDRTWRSDEQVVHKMFAKAIKDLDEERKKENAERA